MRKVRCVVPFFFAGIWRKVGDEMDVENNTARSQIEAGKCVDAPNPAWDTATTQYPWVLRTSDQSGWGKFNPDTGTGSGGGIL